MRWVISVDIDGRTLTSLTTQSLTCPLHLVDETVSYLTDVSLFECDTQGSEVRTEVRTAWPSRRCLFECVLLCTDAAISRALSLPQTCMQTYLWPNL